MALFKSKSQRILKKARDMAAGDMVDQAAVLMEEEIEGLLEEKDAARQIVPFLMDIGHPDLAARLSERIIKAHSDLRAGVVKMLEEKLGHFSRSTELLRVLWRYRLRSKDYNGMIELLSTVDRLTESRFTDTIESAYNSQGKYSGEELKNLEPCLAMAVVLFRKGRPSEAVDVLVDAAERSSFPDESLSRLSGWIANRTGGTDMEVNFGRIRILVSLSDTERAISELSTLLQAEGEILEKAIAITEKSIIPVDSTGRASVVLARLMAVGGRVNEACSVLERLLDRDIDGNTLEQAAAGMVMAAPANARAHLLQARLRLSRNEITQGIDSLNRVFECPDLDQAPVAEVCRSVIEKGMDREGKVTRKLGEFLVERGSVEDAVQVIPSLMEQDPEWVFSQIQKLLQKEKTNASVLTLLAVYKLLAGREGEAGATLQHLSSRKDLKSRSDIAAVLSRLSHLMDRFPRLRRFRASTTGAMGDSSQSAKDWIALLIQGERVPDRGLVEIFDSGLAKEHAQAILDSGFHPDSPAGFLVQASAAVSVDDAVTASPAMTEAVKDPAVAAKVADLVADIRLSMLQKTTPEGYLPALNDAGKGGVVAKLLPLLAEPGAREDWMDALAARVDTGDSVETAIFRLEYFIESGQFGTAAVSVERLEIPPGPVADLADGCRAASSGDRERAVELLSSAADESGIAPMARTVLEFMASEESSGPTAIALAQSLVNTGDVSRAAGVLSGSLNSPEVKAFLEENCPGHVDAWELWKLLALSRLLKGDAAGFRMAATTALEKSGAPALELVEAALAYGTGKPDTDTLLFAVTNAVKHSTGLDVTEEVCMLLRLAPALHGRLSVLELGQPPVKALMGVVMADPELFLADEAPLDLNPPAESVDECIEQWAGDEMWQALHRLMQTCDASNLNDRAHRIRTILAGKGFSDVDSLLFEDARAEPANRLDFWNSVETDEFVQRGLSEFFAEGLSIQRDEADAAGRALARSFLDGEAVLGFAMRLADSGVENLTDTISLLLDKALQTRESEVTPGFIGLLAAGGRVREAYRKARGNDELLGVLRETVARREQFAISTESALWNSGKREAACAGWLALYRQTRDQRYLSELHWALSQMGLADEKAALERFMEERHPGCERASGAAGGRGWILSDLNTGRRHFGRGMTNGR